MKCPICKTTTFTPLTLEDGLPAQTCVQCNGIWISSNPYQEWRRARSTDTPQRPSERPFDPQWETKELKLCPDCGHILARFKIFPDTDYYLDHCHTCNGIWFDKNEWQALAERNLHDNLHEFFTHPWQESLHKQETTHRMEELYLEKFGRVDYQHIQNIRGWLREHPQSQMLLAFLMAEDPYKL